MEHGKSLELRYNAPTKTYENITTIEGAGIFSFFGRPKTYRSNTRAARKRTQLEKRREAKVRQAFRHAGGFNDNPPSKYRKMVSR